VGGQERLARARVLLVGAGGLGSPAALYLAAAGVGTLGIVDGDAVELSNLQRQILHGTGAVGRPKTDSAAERLHDLNPGVAVELHPVRLTSENALEILGGYDLAVDGSDNFPTRYLVNDASVLLKKPYIYGSIFRFDGQVSVFAAPGDPATAASSPSRRRRPRPQLRRSRRARCAARAGGIAPGARSDQVDPRRGRVARRTAAAGGRAPGALPRAERGAGSGVRRLRRSAQRHAAGGLRGVLRGRRWRGPRGRNPGGDLARRLAGPGAPAVLDVREPWEWEIARIQGSRLVPLGELPGRIAELDPRAEIVTVCHKGKRSLMAQQLLQGAGFQARSLAGGIDAWAAEVEPGMRRY